MMAMATATHAWESDVDGDLSFREGEAIAVVSQSEPGGGWWTGTLGGRTGAFPSNHVELTAPQTAPAAWRDTSGLGSSFAEPPPAAGAAAEEELGCICEKKRTAGGSSKETKWYRRGLRLAGDRLSWGEPSGGSSGGSGFLERADVEPGGRCTRAGRPC
jgi:hypothetical protein